MQIEYADRIFVFDSKILVFGGTPAYMFFKYGKLTVMLLVFFFDVSYKPLITGKRIITTYILTVRGL